MTYTLHRLAAGSYDLALDGIIIGRVVREVAVEGRGGSWYAELLDDVPSDQRPAPFELVEHTFPTLEATTAWLGGQRATEAVKLLDEAHDEQQRPEVAAVRRAVR